MIKDLESKILNIAINYLDKQGYKVEIRLFNTNSNRMRAGVEKFDDRYHIHINEDALLSSFEGYTIEEYEEQVCQDLVDTILHECCHIICMEENLGYNDGDYDFEKMLYDNHINSNYHRYPGALTMQEQAKGEKENEEKLCKILNIKIDELYDYLENRENSFCEEYAEYISQILQ